MGTISDKEKGIIQTNKLDKILYEDVIDNSIVLQETIKRGKTIFHSFESLVEEVFYLLYKIVIKFQKDSFPREDAIKNREIIEYLAGSYSIRKIRQRTAGSFPHTALSLKTILDEIIQSLRGSQLSKEIKKLQEDIYTLSKQKQELERKVHDLDCILETSVNNLPLKERNLNLLESIKNLLPLENNSRNILEILQEIIRGVKEFINNPKAEASSYLNSIIEDSIKSLEAKNKDFNNSSSQEILQGLLEEIKENMEYNRVKSDSKTESTWENQSHDHENSTFRNSLKKAVEEIQEEIDNLLSHNSIFSSQRTPDNGDIMDIDLDDNIDKTVFVDGKVEGDAPLFEYSEGNKLLTKDYKELFRFGISNYSNILKDLLIKTEMELQLKKQSLKRQLNKINIDSSIDKAINTTNEFDRAIKTLNINKNSLNNLTFDEIINFTRDYLRPEMKDFIDKVGKKKEIAKKEQGKKKKSKERLTDKTILSSDLDNLVDEELMYLSMGIEVFENNFIERYLHENLITYKRIKYMAKNRGPIILCYDGSGSMEGDKILETKRNIITFTEIARLQRRKMLLIQFASQNEPLFIKEINPEGIDIKDINEIINTFLCGGTDFEKPLRTAINYLKSNNYKNADILFITDGVCSISQNFKEEFLQAKKNSKFKLYTLIIYTDTYGDYGDIGDISDEVMELKRINLSNWNEKISRKLFSL